MVSFRQKVPADQTRWIDRGATAFRPVFCRQTFLGLFCLGLFAFALKSLPSVPHVRPMVAEVNAATNQRGSGPMELLAVDPERLSRPSASVNWDPGNALAGATREGQVDGSVVAARPVVFEIYYCSNCGEEVSATSDGCRHCGVTFENGASAITMGESLTLFFIGFLVLAGLGTMIGLGAFFTIGKKKKRRMGGPRSQWTGGSGVPTTPAAGGLYQSDQKQRWGQAIVPKTISGADDAPAAQLGYAQGMVRPGPPPQTVNPQAGYPQAPPPQPPRPQVPHPPAQRPASTGGYAQGRPPQQTRPGQARPATSRPPQNSGAPVGTPAGYPQAGYPQAGYPQAGYPQGRPASGQRGPGTARPANQRPAPPNPPVSPSTGARPPVTGIPQGYPPGQVPPGQPSPAQRPPAQRPPAQRPPAQGSQAQGSPAQGSPRPRDRGQRPGGPPSPRRPQPPPRG